MADERKIIKKVKSGVPHLFPDVDVYNTLPLHLIESGHVEEHARLDEILPSISHPDEVYKSKTDDRSFCLFKYSITSAWGDPVRIAVKKVSEQEAICSTLHFSDSRNKGELVWSPNTGGQDEAK